MYIFDTLHKIPAKLHSEPDKLIMRSSRIRSRSGAILTFTSVQMVAIFTALYAMQTRFSDENSLCPSVCPSACIVTKRKKICPDFYTIRKII